MIEEKEVKTWWAYLYNNEEYDDDSIVVGELLDHHPKQGPLHWQAGLFEVVQKSEFDKAIAALQWIANESDLQHCIDEAKETLRELGEM